MNADWKLVKLREIFIWIGALLIGGAAGAVCGKALTTPSDNRLQETVSVSAPRQESLSGWFNAEWKSAEEIEVRVAGLSEEQTRAMLQQSDGNFWRGHPNASETFRAALEKLAENAPPLALLADCAAWLDGWQLPDASRRRLWREAVGVIYSRAEVDLTALASLVRGRSEEDIFATLEAFLESRPAASLEEALAQAQQFIAAAGLKDDDGQGARAKALVTTAWLIRAPDEALRLAAATDRMAIREALQEPLRRMRALDPKGAIRLLGLASDLGVYPEAIGETAFIASFTPEQIREAFAKAPIETRRRYLEIYAARADEIAPGELVAIASAFSAEELVAEASGKGRTQYGTLAVIRALAERDPSACEKWLSPLGPKIRREVLDEVLNYPALTDAAFGRFYLDRAGTQFDAVAARHQLRRAAITAIAEESPESALSYLDRIPEQDRLLVEQEVRGRQIAELVSESPTEAMAVAESAAEPLQRDLLARALAMRFEHDPVGAADWLNAVQEPELRKYLEIEVMATGAADPGISAEERYHRLLSLGASETDIHMAMAHFVNGSALLQPEKAGTMIPRLADAKLQVHMTARLMNIWSIHDPAGATAWAATLPPGPNLDAAASEIMKMISDQPEDAFAWAAAITEPSGRYKAVKTLVEAWAAADLRMAERLAGAAPVSDKQRAELQAMLADTPQARREAKGL